MGSASPASGAGRAGAGAATWAVLAALPAVAGILGEAEERLVRLRVLLAAPAPVASADAAQQSAEDLRNTAARSRGRVPGRPSYTSDAPPQKKECKPPLARSC